MGLGRRLLPLVGLIGAVGAIATATGAGGAVRSTATPNAATPRFGGSALLQSIACPSAVACVAGGASFDGQGDSQALVIEESNGIWRRAITVPGTRVLNAGRQASVASVSCSSAGNCAAGGSYVDGSGRTQAFVASERGGVWHTAVEVPGTAALNAGGDAAVSSVSCSGAGNCAAGGWYHDKSGGIYNERAGEQAFVVDERRGVWRKAKEVPGSAALNKAGGATVASLSCTAVTTCAAVGWYADGSGHTQAFVVNKRHGVWRKAREAPGTAALNRGGAAALSSVSCARPGACAAGGSYVDRSGHDQAFVTNEEHGVWHKAREVPGTAALNRGGQADILSISCAGAGNCAAGGFYADRVGVAHEQALVVNEKNGMWHRAKAVPGTKALNTRDAAEVTSVSCFTRGNCAAGGFYSDLSGRPPTAFVAVERKGVWRTALTVPHTAVPKSGGNARVTSVSCARGGICRAAGWYILSGEYRAFVTAP